MFGPEKPRFSEVGDASLVEAVPVVLLVASIVIVGIYPALITDVFSSTLNPMVAARFG